MTHVKPTVLDSVFLRQYPTLTVEWGSLCYAHKKCKCLVLQQLTIHMSEITNKKDMKYLRTNLSNVQILSKKPIPLELLCLYKHVFLKDISSTPLILETAFFHSIHHAVFFSLSQFKTI